MKNIFKSSLIFLMILTLIFSLVSCGSESNPEDASGTSSATGESSEIPSRAFTDSTGRTLTVPGNIEKIAVSGSISQIALISLCPEKLSGLAGSFSDPEKKYLKADLTGLPVLGQLYGGKGTMNPEALLKSGAEIVLDIGEPKKNMAEDLDELEEQTGIPFVHIDGTLQSMGEAYRTLGELLNVSEKAEQLAAFYDAAYEKVKDVSEKVTKKSVLFLSGEEGLNVAPKGSSHGEVFDLLADNLAVLESAVGKGSKNIVDMEQILTWNPEVIFFSSDSVYASVKSDPVWSSLQAVKSGHIYEVPCGPFNYAAYPSSSQRILGLLYVAAVLYPEACDFDLQEEVTEYYKLFYDYDLSDAEYQDLLFD